MLKMIKERYQIEKIYTPLSIAKKEILIRWNDKKLKKKIEDFLDGDVPSFLKIEPKSYLARHIVSPTFEFFRFIEQSQLIGLNPVCPEFRTDKFSSRNIDKYHLARLFFHQGYGKNGGEKISTVNIVNFNTSEGQQMNQLNTLWEEGFISFHHRMLGSVFPKNESILFDFSKWIETKGSKPEKYYLYFLSLFICHAVLFENFLINEDERAFTNDIVIPNFYEVQKIFGLKPLIVPLVASEHEAKLFWRCYPEGMKNFIKV